MNLREKTERVRHCKSRKTKREKSEWNKENMQTKREREREIEGLVWTCRESEVFRRCNLRRFRSRSLWQNSGPPALQLVWATSKKPVFHRDLTVWHLQCVWVNMCASQPGGIERVGRPLSVRTKMNLLGAVNALIVVHGDQVTAASLQLSVCLLSSSFASSHFIVLHLRKKDSSTSGFKGQLIGKIKGLKRKAEGPQVDLKEE